MSCNYKCFLKAAQNRISLHIQSYTTTAKTKMNALTTYKHKKINHSNIWFHEECGRLELCYHEKLKTSSYLSWIHSPRFILQDTSAKHQCSRGPDIGTEIFVQEKITGYLTFYAMNINYIKWNRQFGFSSFSAYHAQNILKMNHARDDQS